MRLITLDDIIDIYSRGTRRGWYFILSKINFRGISRTKSAFNESSTDNSNWWIIPKVKERWNILITGNPQINYKQHLVHKFLNNQMDLRLISIGSGSCSHELELAEYLNFKEILCIDISQSRLLEAQKIARKRNLTNIKFLCRNIHVYNLLENYFDIVLFNSSLHHFENVENLLKSKIRNCLKDRGKLIINEYVGPNRLQYTRNQIKEINNALNLIPKEYKKRFKTNLTKNRYWGSGIIRMIIADPSECIDSANILSSVHSNFDIIIEKPYGGNILMNVLKDISHHFIELDTNKEKILDRLFLFEDQYLVNNSSDFVFGIYKKTI